jgi:hypothetical protein
MAMHNSMVEICCYAAPIAMEIQQNLSIRIEFFNTHACSRQLTLRASSYSLMALP